MQEDTQAAKDGLARQAAGDWPGALKAYEAALASDSANPRLLYLAAIAHAYCGNLPKGLELLTQVTATNPNYGEAHQALGGVLLALGKNEEAAQSLEKAAALLPASASVQYERGAAYLAQKRFPQAADAYRKAAALKPDHADAHNNLGSALKTMGDLSGAAEAYQAAVAAQPDHPQAWSNLGIVQQLQERYPEAIESYRRALTLTPKNVNAENNLGLALRKVRRHEEAVAAFRRAIALAPGAPKAYMNLGAALQDLNRLPEAIAAIQKALVLAPRDVSSLSTLGNALVAANRIEEGLAAYEEARALRPSMPEIRYNIALAQLVSGDFENGWKNYESRTEQPKFKERYLMASPRWTGAEDLTGKTLFVHAEQGLGDTLQFIRFVPPLCKRAARVIVKVQTALKPLLGGRVGTALVLSPDDGLPSHDYHVPLLSLPLVLGVREESIAVGVPYVFPPETRLAQWQQVFARGKGLKVGIVWSGNPKHQYDHNRSIPLREFAGMFKDSPAHVFVVQKEMSIDEARILLEYPNITDLSRKISDFADTAAIVKALDLVITVDTSVAHLAGSMGVPTWILVAYAPDWRWRLKGSTSTWYPSARLYRQTAPDSWAETLRQVSGDLRVLGERALA